MTNLSVFEFNSLPIRVLGTWEAPWFVAKDVCDVLEHTNSRMALDRLDDDEKDVSTIDTLGGEQEMAIISESGLYSLVLTSRKPQAKAFKRWITHEVIPAIRKTGTFSLNKSQSIALPPADVRVSNLTSALEKLGIELDNPRWASGLKDLALDILGIAQPALPASSEQWRGVVEIAESLGFSEASDLSTRSALGRYVSRLAGSYGVERRQERRLCNGTNREIWVYRETPSLQDLIRSFFEIQA